MSCKIYKITCESGNVYYGSTIQTLKERLHGHKYSSKNNTCRNMINPKMELLETCEIKDRYIIERRYIDNNECINKINPIRTEEEKKEQGRRASKNWTLRNKKKVEELRNNIDQSKYRYKITCECGIITTKQNLSRHRKSKKHLDNLP